VRELLQRALDQLVARRHRRHAEREAVLQRQVGHAADELGDLHEALLVAEKVGAVKLGLGLKLFEELLYGVVPHLARQQLDHLKLGGAAGRGGGG
jgi:hypothetical protein